MPAQMFCSTVMVSWALFSAPYRGEDGCGGDVPAGQFRCELERLVRVDGGGHGALEQARADAVNVGQGEHLLQRGADVVWGQRGVIAAGDAGTCGLPVTLISLARYRYPQEVASAGPVRASAPREAAWAELVRDFAEHQPSRGRPV